MTDLYEHLGVARNATPGEIKKAYRKLAMQHHPDKGGDAEKMANLNRAFAVLGDEQKRLEYDRSGSTGEGPTKEERARQLLQQMFGQNLEAKNIVVTLQKTLSRMISEVDVKVKSERMRVRRLMARRSKVVTKNGAENLFTKLIDDQVRQIEQHCAAGENDIEMMRVAVVMLDAYEDTEPEIEPVNWFTGTVAFTR